MIQNNALQCITFLIRLAESDVSASYYFSFHRSSSNENSILESRLIKAIFCPLSYFICPVSEFLCFYYFQLWNQNSKGWKWNPNSKKKNKLSIISKKNIALITFRINKILESLTKNGQFWWFYALTTGKVFWSNYLKVKWMCGWYG